MAPRPAVECVGKGADVSDERASHLIGFLCDTPLLGSGFFGMLQMGLLAACRKDGCELLIKAFDNHAPDVPEQLKSLLERSPLLGVILTQPICNSHEILDVLSAAGVPAVRVAPHSEAKASTIDISIDNFRAAYDTTAHLIGLGHRRIAIVNGPPDHGDAKQRFAGFCRAMKDAGLAVDEALCFRGTFEFDSGVAAGEQMLAMRSRPTAVFAFNDEMAFGVLIAAQGMNLRVPDDLSLAGFDDSPLARMMRPNLTTCRQKMELMGFQAANFLIHPPPAPEACKVVLEHELIVRQSTARIP